METTEMMPSRAPLGVDDDADVVIIGAGIAGLTTAYLLSREGQRVIVLDDGPLAGGETERTTAHLASALDDRFVELEKMHGEHGARLAAESHAAAIDLVERTVQLEEIDCDFLRVDGWLIAPPRDPQHVLHNELAAARRAGLAAELRERVPGLAFDTGAALCFPRQAQLHPLKYVRALALAAERDGARIFTGTHAQEIKGGASAQVTTSDGHVVKTRAVIVATNSPINDRVAMHTKQASYRSYVVGLEVAKGAVPAFLLWDTEDPYHYVRLQDGDANDVLIVGGEDHKTGQDGGVASSDRFARLERWARERFPVERTLQRWSGQVVEPSDGLAYIGRNPGREDNIFIATGDSGHGITHGTIAGMIFRDLILGRDNAWASLYDPSRAPAAREFLRENLNTAAQYAAWAKAGDVESVASLRPGEGAVIRRGLSLVAAYCEPSGAVRECSATCPHLGAVVSWNAAEKTWDCPAHGSRFTADGDVVNGPANRGLEPREPPQEAEDEVPALG